MKSIDTGFAALVATTLACIAGLLQAPGAEAAVSIGDPAAATARAQGRAEPLPTPTFERAGGARGSDGPTQQDYASVVASYRDDAYQGDPRAQVIIGVMYANGQGVRQDYALARMWFTRGAARGDASAQLNLGDMYANGLGVPTDYVEAIRWYRLAADQGFVHAQNALGTIYRDGRGVPQDYAEAVKWYRKAAELDDVRAQANLAYMYANGLGVARDLVEACKWYMLASNRHVSSDREGREYAARERELIATRMTPVELGRAQKLVRDWRPR
jgi:TPR repeat protein